MARIRNIKPDAFDDPDLCRLSPILRWLFAGLWTQADREGRLLDEPDRLKSRLLPRDAVDVDALLDTLAAGRFIQRYTVKGRRYIWIPHFAEHQYVSKREPASTLPGPVSSRSRTSTRPVLDQSQTSPDKSGQVQKKLEDKRSGQEIRTTEVPPTPKGGNGRVPSESPDNGRSERLWSRFVELAQTYRQQSFPLIAPPKDAGHAMWLCQQYPDDNLLFAIMELLVRSERPDWRAKPLSLGWMRYWAPTAEEQIRSEGKRAS